MLLKEKVANLQKKITERERWLQVNATEKKEFEDALQVVRNEIDSLNKSTQILTISDHAFVRWMERIRGIPVDDLKKEALEGFPNYLSDGVHKTNGMSVTIRDNTIITIY